MIVISRNHYINSVYGLRYWNYDLKMKSFSLKNFVHRTSLILHFSGMKSLFVTGMILFMASSLKAQIPVIGADSLMKHYSYKMNHFIDRDTSLSEFYSIDLFGISVYADAAKKKASQPEFSVNWSELSIYKNIIATAPREEAMQIMLSKGNRPFPPDVVKRFGVVPDFIGYQATSKLPLKGLKIVLDPGHIASDTAMGRMEDKFLLFRTSKGPTNAPRSSNDSVTISIAEGMLTWQTANALAVLLRNEGAEVLVTRPRINITAFGKTYEQWKKDDYARTLDSLLRVYPEDVHLLKLKSGRIKDENSIFRYVFRDAELRKRAEIINAFHPDLTLIIHYNVDEKNKPWNAPSPKDYCMTFVPGSFQQGELSDSERRFDFLRLVLTDEIEKSTAASGLVALEFKSELEVPLARQSDATYLQEHCIPAGLPGVFCRNLSLTRLVQGTMIYGETFYQDNVDECLRLTEKQKFTSEGQQPIAGNERVSEVVDAYNKAILLWAKSR
jgi:N-acetylmuramoyl-L-alanine amidase